MIFSLVYYYFPEVFGLRSQTFLLLALLYRLKCPLAISLGLICMSANIELECQSLDYIIRSNF